VGDQLFGGELAWGLGRGVAVLGHGHNEIQMHVQSELEDGFGGINHRRGQRLSVRHEGLGRTLVWFAKEGIGG